MAEFRCSYNVFGIRSLAEFTETCRRAEQLGYDTVFAADHLGTPSPFPALVAAAHATERLRVGTLVINVPFWNPACSPARSPPPTSSPAAASKSASGQAT